MNIDNETDNHTIIGIEHKLLQLSCNVVSGIPPEIIIWKRDGIILKIGGPLRNVYEFYPERTDNNLNLTCEVINELTKKPLTQTVRLEIKCNSF